MNKKHFQSCIEIAKAEFDKIKRLNDDSPYLHWTFVFQFNELLDWSTNRKADSYVRFGYESGRRYDHAEPRAIGKARGLLDFRRGFEVFNVRLNRSIQPAMARPCAICESFLTAMGCTNCYYTDGKGVSKLAL